MEEKSVEIARLIARYLRGQELQSNELDQLQAFLDTDKRNRAILDHYRNTPDVEKRLAYLFARDKDKAKAWSNVLKKSNRKVNPYYLYLKYVAAITLLVLCAKVIHWKLADGISQQPSSYVQGSDIVPGSNTAILTLSDGRKVTLGDDQVGIKEVYGSTIYGKNGELDYFSKDDNFTPHAEVMNKLEVPKGGTYRLVLPDSSVVWLNAKSEIQFPARFASTERSVMLTGEAYFDVVKNPKAPFTVIVNNQKVEVLGTSFTIRAYDTRSVTTTVITGEVSVETGVLKTRVQAGQQAESTGSDTVVSDADTEKASAWKDGYFYFDEDPFEEVLEQISRWYDIEIQYEASKKLGTFGGSITRDMELSQVLEMISEISDLSFEINGRIIHVKENENPKITSL